MVELRNPLFIKFKANPNKDFAEQLSDLFLKPLRKANTYLKCDVSLLKKNSEQGVLTKTSSTIEKIASYIFVCTFGLVTTLIGLLMCKISRTHFESCKAVEALLQNQKHVLAQKPVLPPVTLQKIENKLLEADAVQEATPPTPQELETTLHVINDFSYRFQKELTSKESNVISPFCLYSNLCMVLKGMPHEKKGECLKALGIKNGELNESRLLASVGHLYNKYKDNLFSAMLSKGDVNSYYHDTIKKVLNGEIIPISTNVKEQVNKWVSDKTQGRIKELVKEDVGDVSSVLLTALLFQILWKTPFKPNETTEWKFNCSDGSQSDVMFMKQTDNFETHEANDYKMLKIQGKDPNSFIAFYVPKKPKLATPISLEALEEKLTPEEISLAFSTAVVKKRELIMPLLDIKSNYSFAHETIEKLGFPINEELVNLCPKSQLSKMIHETTFLANEKGATVAAATTGMLKSVNVAKSFMLDRNFIFIAYVDGMQVCRGRVMDDKGLVKKDKYAEIKDL